MCTDGLLAAWLASPLAGFAFFLLMRRWMLAKSHPFVLRPVPGAVISSAEDEPFTLRPAAAPAQDRRSTMRVLSLNMCLLQLPGGLSFSSTWNDKKDERIDMLLGTLEKYDVLLINQMWGCWWSAHHTRFFQLATERGFYVCASPVRYFPPPSPLAAIPVSELDTVCASSGRCADGLWQCHR